MNIKMRLFRFGVIYMSIRIIFSHTSEFIKNYYKGLDCQVRDCGDGYGIVVDINADKPGKKLAWRADFDALPIQEDNDLPFKSQKPGVMHASGSIRLIHQPAEEVAPGGALSTIKEMTLMMFAVFTL